MPLPVVAGVGMAAAGKAAGVGAAAGGGMLKGIAGPILAGGMGLLGGAMSNEYQWKALQEQQRYRTHEMKNAIRWRVSDAIKSGIHPLYALGMNPPSSFPIALNDNVGPAVAEMGQNLGNAIHRMSDSAARDKHQMEMALGEAQLDVMSAQAQMYRSQAMQNMQAPAAPAPGLGLQNEGAPSGSVSGVVEQIGGQEPVVPGYFEVKPAEVVSPKIGEKSVQAGINPYGEEQWYHNRLPMMVPRTQGESIEEIWSEMSLPAFMGWVLRNGQIYGEGWIQDFINMRYFGKTPMKNWGQMSSQPKPDGSAVLDADWKYRIRKEYNDLVEKYGEPLRRGVPEVKARFKKEWAETWKRIGGQVDKR